MINGARHNAIVTVDSEIIASVNLIARIAIKVAQFIMVKLNDCPESSELL